MEYTGLRKKVSSKELSKHIEKIWDNCIDLNPASSSKYKDGIDHCIRVDKNLERLVINKVGGIYSNHEKFLLSASAATHDIYKGSETPGEDHGETVSKKLQEISCLGNGNILNLIGYIVSIHDRGSIRNIPTSSTWDGQSIFLPRLALLFKLADMLDCTYKRINNSRILAGIETPGNKEISRQGISDWDLDGKDKIKIILIPKTKEQLESSMIAFKMIDNELAQHDLALHLLQFPTSFSPELFSGPGTDSEIKTHFENIKSGKISLDLPVDPKITYSSRKHIRLFFYIKGQNKVLMKYHKRWGQWLLPNLPLIFRSEQNVNIIIENLSMRYDLPKNEFELKKLSEAKSIQKMSKENKQMTAYQYRIAEIQLSATSEYSQTEFYKQDDVHFKWIPIEECVSDKKIYEGNKEIIGHIAKIFKVPFTVENC